MQTSERGWVRVTADTSFWIPCPAALPEGIGRQSWATAEARAWWSRPGLARTDSAVTQLAEVLGFVQEHGYTMIPCHQIWIYLRDPAIPPLPVHIAIWKSEGERARRLRELTGADDQASARRPDVSEVVTANLGVGLRVLRCRTRADDPLIAVLGYGFRSEELETDVQVFTRSASLLQLTTSFGDIDEFVHGLTIHAGGANERRVAFP